jgi:hypothetical protein
MSDGRLVMRPRSLKMMASPKPRRMRSLRLTPGRMLGPGFLTAGARWVCHGVAEQRGGLIPYSPAS